VRLRQVWYRFDGDLFSPPGETDVVPSIAESAPHPATM